MTNWEQVSIGSDNGLAPPGLNGLNYYLGYIILYLKGDRIINQSEKL